MFLSDADQLREARAFSKELESNVRRLARERDEARAAFAGAENSLTAERKHSARLSRECQERHDELRAEVEKLGKALTLETRLSLSTQRKLDEARAEVERLRAGLSYAERERDRWMAQARVVAVSQRDADLHFILKWVRTQPYATSETLADDMPVPPLVTEGDK